jgi:hypothetical protein
MSLEALFEDRIARKFLRDGISEATDSGNGVCSVCGKESYLLHAFGQELCESCCNQVLEVAEDYDNVLSGEFTNKTAISMIREAYFVPDMSKIQADANSKFNGDIPKLMASYGLTSPKDWDDRLKDGYLWAEPGDLKSGKTHLNKFLNDYSCTPAPRSNWKTLVADADGTTWNNNPSTGASPAGPAQPKPSFSGASSKASSSNLVGYISGSLQLGKFEIQIGDNAELYVDVTSSPGQPSTYSVGYSDGTGSSVISVKASKEITDIKAAAEFIKSEVAKNPQALFPAFSETKDGIISIVKYDIYKFQFDEKSFGTQLSLAIIYKDNKSSARVTIPGKALNSKITMSTVLTDFMDSVISKKIPAYIKNPKFKTSIGTATFDLESIEGDLNKDDAKNVTLVFKVNYANTSFKGRSTADRFSNTGDSKDAYSEMILNVFVQKNNPMIPGFSDESILSKKNTVGRYDIQLPDYSIYAEFDDQTFYDKGDIVFNMSVLDSKSGTEQPKKLRPYVYRKSGTNLKDFLQKNGADIHDEFFKASSMVDTMTQSAIDKMKVPSKKAALMDKIANKLIKELRLTKLSDLETELDMKVNKDGKVINVTLTVTDPYNDVSQSPDDLADNLKLDKSYKWLGSPKVIKDRSGEPKVSYPVTDVEEFSKIVNLPLFEEAILEAFGIIMISESGRKQFHI